MGNVIEVIFLIVLGFLFLINILFLLFSKSLKAEENSLSGFEVARIISSKLCVEEPHIIKKKGKFLDYYDINRHVIKLSPEVFDGTDLFACCAAINVAIATDNKHKKMLVIRNLNAFLVMISYLVIILGAFLNNANFIHFGMLLFIVAFLIESFNINVFGKKDKNRQETYDFINDCKVMDDYEENIDSAFAYSIVSVANLPYRFITFFR